MSPTCPRANPLVAAVFEFNLSHRTPFSDMSATQKPFSTRASRRRAKDSRLMAPLLLGRPARWCHPRTGDLRSRRFCLTLAHADKRACARPFRSFSVGVRGNADPREMPDPARLSLARCTLAATRADAGRLGLLPDGSAEYRTGELQPVE